MAQETERSSQETRSGTALRLGRALPWLAAAAALGIGACLWLLSTARAEVSAGGGTTEDARRSTREREIARMISALDDVRSARVLLGGGASVTLELREGIALSAETASAVAGLVASAVPDLSPEDVVVVDSRDPARTHRLRSGGDAASEGAAALRLRRDLERALADRLRALFSGMGIDCVAVVSAEIDLDRVEERLVELDPEGKGEVILKETRGLAPRNRPAAVSGAAAGRPASLPGENARGRDDYREIEAEVSRLTKEVTKAVGAVANVRASVVLFDRRVQEKDGTWKYDTSVGDAANLEKYKKLAVRALGLEDYDAGAVEVHYMKSASATPSAEGPPARLGGVLTWMAAALAVIAVGAALVGGGLALGRIRRRRREARRAEPDEEAARMPEVPPAERLRREAARTAGDDVARTVGILRRWITREG